MLSGAFTGVVALHVIAGSIFPIHTKEESEFITIRFLQLVGITLFFIAGIYGCYYVINKSDSRRPKQP